ncbi:hypothetical protein P7K49_038314 [Saguinus oedipus]|uniref:SAM domain-containing protein n=1 Tax=Saguinus oedipus TaxID=9490 RepID=A0ABQ9TF36_SAGOE|nr:hypothetical protein P7K49_038314 [Saguinus oedipus]
MSTPSFDNIIVSAGIQNLVHEKMVSLTIKTRISTHDDDKTVYCAYERKQKFAPETKTEFPLESTSLLLRLGAEEDTLCWPSPAYLSPASSLLETVIYDAVQNMDKKIDVINRKVSKIQRFNAKAVWKNHKPSGFRYGYAYRNYSYLLAKKLKLQKGNKSHACETFSYSQSYSPTSPVSRSNNPAPSFLMEEYQRAEPEDDPVLSRTPSPMHPSDHGEHDFQPSYACDGAMPSSSGPYRGSSRANSNRGKYSPDRPFAVQGEPSLVHAPEMMSYSALVENRHIVSSACFCSGFVVSIPMENDWYLDEDNFIRHPATWSVEAVILFLKQTDPKTLGPLVDIFRSHEIDGKALLLLTSDVMLKYLGLKLGTTMKLCYYIERLKQGKCFEN